MTIIRVTQSGGFAGRVRTGVIDTRTEPHAHALETFLAGRSGFPRTGGMDRLLYTFEVSGRRVTVGGDELPTELASMVRDALRR